MNHPHRSLVLERIVIDQEGKPLIALEASVAPGEVLTVMGPSGVGKSTLLAYIAGFLDPAFSGRGRVWLGDADVTALPPERRRIGLLFQDALLFPHLSVGGNLAFGMPRGGTRRARVAHIDEALAEVGLAGFAGRDPATLSGGQRARIALLRVLLAEPRAILLDEPFSRLDAALRDEIRRLTFARLRRQGVPALLVTHDEEDARSAGGAVVKLA